MVCDYSALNMISIPESTSLPLIEESLDHTVGAMIFSQIDVVGLYHPLRVNEKDIRKIAIKTRVGCFECRVLCFGLTNAPSAFTRLISAIFHELEGSCMITYLDDILIHSHLGEEHVEH